MVLVTIVNGVYKPTNITGGAQYGMCSFVILKSHPWKSNLNKKTRDLGAVYRLPPNPMVNQYFHHEKLHEYWGIPPFSHTLMIVPPIGNAFFFGDLVRPPGCNFFSSKENCPKVSTMRLGKSETTHLLSDCVILTQGLGYLLVSDYLYFFALSKWYALFMFRFGFRMVQNNKWFLKICDTSI